MSLLYFFLYNKAKSQDFVTLGGEAVLFPKDAQALCDSECMVDFECLVSSYPKIVTGMVADKNKILWLIINNQKKVLYDDGKKRTYKEALNSGTVRDSMSQLYPIGSDFSVPNVDFAPGRIRSDDFLQAIYGNSESVVRSHLVKLKFQEKEFLFTTIGNASKALECAFHSINMLLKNDCDCYLSQYVFPLGGTFNWRKIQDTNRLSPHSYGIAIDLNPKKGLYWLWTKDREEYLKALKAYPKELVKVFEDNGFIWGGKWHEFDFMHFEYRPELLCKSCMVSKRSLE